jgi:hypothetical protein
MGILWALGFSVAMAILTLLRKERYATAAIGNFFVDLVILFFVDSIVFYYAMPSFSLAGLVPFLFLNLMIVTVVAISWDLGLMGVSAGSVLGGIAVIAISILWIVGDNSGHNAYKASHIVPVSVESNDAMPASSTSNMVVVSPDIATTRAKQAMSAGIAGQRNYNTYLNLTAPALQYVSGHMWYVFALHFDSSRNKHHLHNIEPGYIMVSAEDPNAEPIEHYDGQYTMKICLDCGQSSEPQRYAYNNGYKVVMDDPTLELDDQGHPYWTMSIDTPHNGWTFYAPSSVLVIDAHTGDIKKYNLNSVPSWIDRVYSQHMAANITDWYGNYAHAGFKGIFGIGGSNSNRLKVSGDPVLVYTGDGHPDWRVLLTSYNSDAAVSKIVIMDAHTGAMRVYTPANPMGVEAPVTEAFDSASGQGATLIKANKYQAVDLTLHVIYGHLTWMATYEPEGTSPSFVGLGFVDAYHATAQNVVFGDSKSAALQNYLTQLAAEGTANGNAPEQGNKVQTINGTISALSWDISNGQKFWYIALTGDNQHVYVGTVSSLGPALVLAKQGDPVTITMQNTGTDESTRTMQSFTDANVPLKPAGS